MRWVWDSEEEKEKFDRECRLKFKKRAEEKKEDQKLLDQVATINTNDLRANPKLRSLLIEAATIKIGL